MVGRTIFYATLLFWAALVVAKHHPPSRAGLQKAAKLPIRNVYTSHGCYGSLPAAAKKRPVKHVTSYHCVGRCKIDKKPVAILRGLSCYCADTYPALKSLVLDERCDVPCASFASEACGGLDAYSVYNTGQTIDVPDDGDADAGEPSTTSSTFPSAATTVPNTEEPSSCPSRSVRLIISDAAFEFTAAVAEFAGKIQSLFNKWTSRPEDRVKQSSIMEDLGPSEELLNDL